MSNKGGFIIKITNTITGHFILGATINFSIYRRDMLKRLVDGKFRNRKFQNSFVDLKYVEFDILEMVRIEDVASAMEATLEVHRRKPLCCNRIGRFALVEGPASYILTMPSGVYYVGSTGRLDARLRVHRKSLRKGNHYNSRLQNDFTTWDEVEVEFTEHSSAEEARLIEQGLLDKHYGQPMCCNVSSLADGSNSQLGKVRSKEHCMNLSKALTGIPKKKRGT